MTHTVTLGAPSLTGEDANLLVSALFADAAYPLTVSVQNHMPRDVVFPEVGGLFLRHVANAKDSQATVVIADHDQFQRLASSVAQIADLNGYAQALTISAVSGTVNPSPETPKEPEAPKEPEVPETPENPAPKTTGKRGKSDNAA